MLQIFRDLAEELASEKKSKETNSEEVRQLAQRRRIAFVPGNWMGSIFDKERWNMTKKLVKRTHESSKGGGFIRVWKLKKVKQGELAL